MSTSQHDRLYDLTQLSGIADATQDWLRETFNVQTYRDLAGLSVDEVATKYKAAGKIPSRKSIEGWIEQAKARARAAPAKAAANSEKRDADTKDEWRSVALFFVELKERVIDGKPTYETMVLDDENEDTERWPGVEQHQWVAWITARLAKHVEDVQPEVSARQPAMELTPVEEPEVPHETPPIKSSGSVREEEDAGGDAESEFSDELRQIIEKVKVLAEASSQPSRILAARPAPQPQRKDMANIQSAEPILSPNAGQFSEKLQQVIDKSRRLAGRRD
jgi:hypothetical protein